MKYVWFTSLIKASQVNFEPVMQRMAWSKQRNMSVDFQRKKKNPACSGHRKLVCWLQRKVRRLSPKRPVHLASGLIVPLRVDSGVSQRSTRNNDKE